jgi:hypothetical protein
MSKLACNIVLYRPDPEMLAARFRYWHVEELLNQANVLINRCLEDFKEYSALDYEWNQFLVDLESQEKKAGLYSPPTEKDIFDREVAAPQQAEGEAEAQQPLGEEILTLMETAEEGEAKVEAEEAPVIKSSLDLRAEAVQRKKELSAPGRPFALNERRDLALQRLCRDYEEAVNRACVAEEGLNKIYGQVGASSPLPSAAEQLGASITSLSTWIRNSTEWLAVNRLLEEPFTRVVSVRALLNRNAWALLKHSRDSYSLKMQVPVELFRGHDNCRVHGISAALVGEAGTVPWTVIVRLPDDAVYERSGLSVYTDQSDRPTCLLGHVERRSAHPAQVCGGRSLFNASPIGRSTPEGLWSLDIIKPVGATSESFHHLEDVVLEIRAVGKPQKMTG